LDAGKIPVMYNTCPKRLPVLSFKKKGIHRLRASELVTGRILKLLDKFIEASKKFTSQYHNNKLLKIFEGQ
jgi:hypothetical protein